MDLHISLTVTRQMPSITTKQTWHHNGAVEPSPILLILRKMHNPARQMEKRKLYFLRNLSPEKKRHTHQDSIVSYQNTYGDKTKQYRLVMGYMVKLNSHISLPVTRYICSIIIRPSLWTIMHPTHLLMILPNKGKGPKAWMEPPAWWQQACVLLSQIRTLSELCSKRENREIHHGPIGNWLTYIWRKA